MENHEPGTAKSKAERLSWAEKIRNGQEQIREKLVDTGSALPIDDIDQFPGILIELELNLPFFVHCELTQGIKNTGALALVLIVEIKFTGSEVEGLRFCIPVNFAE